MIGSGATVVVVVGVPVIEEASLRSARIAPVPTNNMAANTAAVTSSGRYQLWADAVTRAGASGTKRTRGRGEPVARGASDRIAIGPISGTSSISDQASARSVADCAADRTGVTVQIAAPMAATSSGFLPVMTGSRSCWDSAVVTAGMLAPPPTVATAVRSAR